MEGETLRSVPRGYPPDHPLAEDLKAKDFVGMRNLSEQAVLADGFIDSSQNASPPVGRSCDSCAKLCPYRSNTPLMRQGGFSAELACLFTVEFFRVDGLNALGLRGGYLHSQLL